MNLFEITAYADTAAGTAQDNSPMGAFSAFIPFILIIVVMYFMMIRPQKKKEKLKQEMLSQLIVGDKILTIGGIHGKIVSIKGDNLFIETGKGGETSTIKIARWAISEVTKPGDGSAQEAADEVGDSEE